MTTFYQKEIRLPAFSRGFHLITHIIEREFVELQEISIGTLQVFIQHTSASLTINENADPTVRLDFESHMNQMVPENAPYFKHTLEGPDDMPAHIKSALMGNSLSIPITNGTMNLGIWQGIYLCEHRNHGGSRKIVVTAFGNQRRL
ncbi:secondary thiamine-phosphate synthase enzyme YjbQ [Fulvivirgaceae bacterium BMA10]|uniref:Secondary thiamine-phosphate synthase enzyme YjbQ n=1 Tax=Splendidivirga corallicola TaxID=3051826 RepID=A0ABT8KMV3_9BACT|nr:secondary thiamine-phosphate synthase enzyme YjbQ [Fulvivirgaceae bacterium BMA10]